MSKLDEAREIINEVDKEMLRLFEKRMSASKMVALYKKENSLPVFDETREKALKKNNLAMITNSDLKEYYETFFEGVLKASKDYQKDLLKK